MKAISILFVCLIFLGSSLKAYDDAFEAQMAGSYTIDGNGSEAFWTNCEWYNISYVWLPWGETVAPADFSGKFKMAWTEDVLLVLAEIEDNIFSDEYVDPFMNYWMDDCFEVFLDEDHSGGPHTGGAEAYNAFAYHVSTLYDAVDIGSSGSVLLNDHVEVVITNNGNIYTWELAIQIYDDTYDEGSSNTPVVLTANKEMGLSVAYCDNDGTGDRENFIGAVNVSEADQNTAYQNADVFGTLTLMGSNPNSIQDSYTDKPLLSVYPSHVENFIYVSLTESPTESIGIQVYNLDGRLLVTDIIPVKETRSFQLNLGMLQQGAYIIRLNTNKLNYSKLFYKN